MERHFHVLHSLSKFGLLLHKMGFVKTAVPITVLRYMFFHSVFKWYVRTGNALREYVLFSFSIDLLCLFLCQCMRDHIHKDKKGRKGGGMFSFIESPSHQNST